MDTDRYYAPLRTDVRRFLITFDLRVDEPPMWLTEPSLSLKTRPTPSISPA